MIFPIIKKSNYSSNSFYIHFNLTKETKNLDI